MLAEMPDFRAAPAAPTTAAAPITKPEGAASWLDECEEMALTLFVT
jgi:hypothetical protein